MAAAPPLDIYCIAIGGTGMAPLACLLGELGHRVRGSDGPLYPPMSTLLDNAGIQPHVGYDPAHLEPRPDLVVVGNAVPRSNPEATAVEQLGVRRLSMPQAIAEFFLAGRRPLVVAGTHGKTTTTALAAWVYSRCGADPGYLIGGLPLDLDRSFRVGGGERFVIEGDEYNAAYFDRGPKFLHYRPETLILTSAELDHADLYPDLPALTAAYRQLVALLPRDGLLIACGDSAEVRRIAAGAPCRTVLYGLGADNQVRPAAGVAEAPGGSRWVVDHEGQERVELSLGIPGLHNVANALAVWTAARRDGLPADGIVAALASFRGVRRRLEERGTAAGITVVEDFAHHPTAVAASVAALAARYPGRRRLVLFEPRSLTAGRDLFRAAYVEAFAAADLVLLAPIYHRHRLADGEVLDIEALRRALASRGVEARTLGSVDEVLAAALDRARPGDVVVTMSSGAFGALPDRLLHELGGDGPAAPSPPAA